MIIRVNIIAIIYVYILLTQTVFATIQNSSFEQWGSEAPLHWNVIDSGITVTESTQVVFDGVSSAMVTVNTSTQSATDFRQTVDVIQGQSYEFSVRVYHTQGGVRSRLYVDGYYGYSQESLINQWQEVSQLYTASHTGSIDIGLRFYDVTGFDGSEVVYIDSFGPSSQDENRDQECEQHEVSLHLQTDNYGSETSWSLATSTGQIKYSGDNYGNNASFSQSYCLSHGDYIFVIKDSYGDGICCNQGQGSYSLAYNGATLASGGEFLNSDSVSFRLPEDGEDNGDDNGDSTDLDPYYDRVEGLSGYALKTELYNIINNHNNQGYSNLMTFYSLSSLDSYFENDGRILDIYSENPNGVDPYSYIKISDQCGNYSREGDCYNREHSFPRSWFGGDVEPMNSDAHQVFASDGYVNGIRGSYPYGEVSHASYTSQNGSKLGSASASLGYNGTVFEPIDEFKGDLARAYFYMATRYENSIHTWASYSTFGDAVLNGSSNQVYEVWFLTLLKRWHKEDPVSQLEMDRNESVYAYQNNRNPFIDYPKFVSDIWGD